MAMGQSIALPSQITMPLVKPAQVKHRPTCTMQEKLPQACQSMSISSGASLGAAWSSRFGGCLVPAGGRGKGERGQEG